MSLVAYFIVGGVIDAVVGLSLGLGFGRSQTSTRVVVLILSVVVAFVCQVGFLVGWSVVYGQGVVKGLAWALMYSPIILGLSAGTLVFCLLGTILCIGIARLTKH